MNRGGIGARALNVELQASMNPARAAGRVTASSIRSCQITPRSFRMWSPARDLVRRQGRPFLPSVLARREGLRTNDNDNAAAIAPKGGASSRRLRSNYRYPHQPYISAPFYLFSCACRSGFGLKGVISSSSRHTTRFLNRHPCGSLPTCHHKSPFPQLLPGYFARNKSR
jgi:hypothetical protein